MKFKKRNKFVDVILNRSILVLVIFVFALAISGGRKVQINAIGNINGARSLEANNIVARYDNKSHKINAKAVTTIEEIVKYAPAMPVSFTGQMTAYNVLCKGCTGKVFCPPRQDITNDNIFFEDSKYGKVRIIAADRNIPCGTIMQIKGLNFTDEVMFAVVLDRGGAINGLITDLLVTESFNLDIVGRQRNAQYEILRWGW